MKRGDYESESEESYSASESDDSDDEDYSHKKVPAKKTSAVAGPPAKKKSRGIDGKAASE